MAVYGLCMDVAATPILPSTWCTSGGSCGDLAALLASTTSSCFSCGSCRDFADSNFSEYLVCVPGGLCRSLAPPLASTTTSCVSFCLCGDFATLLLLPATFRVSGGSCGDLAAPLVFLTTSSFFRTKDPDAFVDHVSESFDAVSAVANEVLAVGDRSGGSCGDVTAPSGFPVVGGTSIGTGGLSTGLQTAVINYSRRCCPWRVVLSLTSLSWIIPAVRHLGVKGIFCKFHF